jgi:hypothetical protein
MSKLFYELKGFNRDTHPIRRLGPNMIATACMITCSECGESVRHNGGPARGAKCVSCTQAELVKLCGGAAPVGIQCVYTERLEDKSIQMCEAKHATFCSVYLRLPVGEVVPVHDYYIQPENPDRATERAADLVNALAYIFGIELEPQGALDSDLQP